MVLENSKHYSYTIHPVSAKVYENIGYYDGIQANFSWQLTIISFANFVAL